MKIPKFAKDFYNDIKGNLKYDLSKFIVLKVIPIFGVTVLFSATILGLVLYFVGYDRLLLNGVIISSLIALSFICFLFTFFWGRVTKTEARDFHANAAPIPSTEAREIDQVKLIRGELKACEDRSKNQVTDITNLTKELNDLKLANEHLETKVDREQSASSEMRAESQKFIRVLGRAKDQQQRVDEYVILEDFWYCYILAEPVPLIVLAVEIHNQSFFEISLDKTIGGILKFDNLVLRRQPNFSNGKDQSLSPAIKGLYKIEFEITDEQRKFILETFPQRYNIEDTAKGFQVDELVLTIKGANDSDDVISRPLKIAPGRPVINRQKYEKAIEPFY